MLDSEIIKAAAELMGPCPGCGGMAKPSLAEAQEWLETDERLRRSAPGLRAAVNSKSYLCAACYLRETSETAERQRAGALRQHIDSLYARGLLNGASRNCRFDRSNAELEAVNPDAWKVVRSLPLKKNLWLCGPPGTGKSFAARCVLNNHAALGQTAAELRAVDLAGIAQERNSLARVSAYCYAVILLLDDLDKLPPWPSHLQLLYAVLDHRNQRGLRTMVTANQTGANTNKAWQAAKQDNPTLSAAIFDRLHPIEPIVFQGESARRTRQA